MNFIGKDDHGFNDGYSNSNTRESEKESAMAKSVRFSEPILLDKKCSTFEEKEVNTDKVSFIKNNIYHT